MLVVMQSCDSHFEYLMSRSLNLSCLQVTPSNVDCVLSENVEDIDFVFFSINFQNLFYSKTKIVNLHLQKFCYMTLLVARVLLSTANPCTIHFY